MSLGNLGDHTLVTQHTSTTMSIIVPVTKDGHLRARDVLTRAFRELGFTPRIVPGLTPVSFSGAQVPDPKVKTEKELVAMAKRVAPFFRVQGIDVVDCVFYDVETMTS